MQKTLYALLELQEVDNRLDELEEERGDLPQIVEELKAKIEQKQTELSEVIEGLKESKVKERELELTINEAKQKLNKYEEQLYQVKTNKEYDAITLETEAAKLQMDESESQLFDVTENMEMLEDKKKELEAELVTLQGEFEENSNELQIRLKATAEEETLLKREREIVVQSSGPEIIKTYEMVRKARGGKGIAIVENNTCGGCYSYIPPQKLVEIKKMKEIYTCEFCGRILIWDQSQS